jgi:hypothetical protein
LIHVIAAARALSRPHHQLLLARSAAKRYREESSQRNNQATACDAVVQPVAGTPDPIECVGHLQFDLETFET